MSQSLLHVCKICGKWFATAKGVYGHQRVHSELKRKPRVRVCSVSTSIESKALDPLLSLKESSSYSFMSEVEKQEMDEAAMSLVMLSEGVCVDQPKQEFFSEVSATCSDVVVAQALPSPLRSKSLGKRECNFSYRIKICGKSFERSLGGHSLPVLADSGAKKVVPEPSCFEVSQEELVERGDADVEEHSVEAKQGFSKVSSHSGFEKSSSYSDVVAQEALLIPLGSRLQEAPESNSSYRCKVCGKSFGCFQSLGGHQNLHIGGKRKRSEAEKIVPQPSSFEVSQEEHSVELKEGFEKLSTCSDVLAQPSSCRKDYRVTPAMRML
ncbi:uncharacterized protein LOC103875082 [Brassica rapa]|uniref:C2H2-type domain-containing protein n=2 Tax=Brassica TaxID=3705 RepID=A0A3P5YMM7_BRACM|nr:uncharacterized protein LOC103875082 [Brassica rapa]CAF2089869.1 unnamed protein product [Brassica napus]CAG7872522.1 unnamed protein product [Brassica rapa]VDC68369.1 unnamed protein product [Brassica rapa]